MENLLFDVLTGDSDPPIRVDAGGGSYLIITDFRHWMRAESHLLNGAVDERNKLEFLLSAYAPAVKAGQIDLRAGYPFTIEEGVWALQNFYRAGARPSPASAPARKQDKIERGYDYIYDIRYIYAAFLTAYGIDLRAVDDMHWWVFCALFTGLPSDTEIKTLMRARTERIKKPTKEQLRVKRELALPESIRWLTPSANRAPGFNARIAAVKRKLSSRKQ